MRPQIEGEAKLAAHDGKALGKILRDALQQKIGERGMRSSACLAQSQKTAIEDGGWRAHGGPNLLGPARLTSPLARPAMSG